MKDYNSLLLLVCWNQEILLDKNSNKSSSRSLSLSILLCHEFHESLTPQFMYKCLLSFYWWQSSANSLVLWVVDEQTEKFMYWKSKLQYKVDDSNSLSTGETSISPFSVCVDNTLSLVI